VAMGRLIVAASITKPPFGGSHGQKGVDIAVEDAPCGEAGRQSSSIA
jgi:hypothetical protein